MINSETMPDDPRIEALARAMDDERPDTTGFLNLRPEWKRHELNRAAKLIAVIDAVRADRIDPAILAAIDETLAYFDGSTGGEEDTPIHSWVPHGLTIGILRTLRGMFNG